MYNAKTFGEWLMDKITEQILQRRMHGLYLTRKCEDITELSRELLGLHYYPVLTKATQVRVLMFYHPPRFRKPEHTFYGLLFHQLYMLSYACFSFGFTNV